MFRITNIFLPISSTFPSTTGVIVGFTVGLGVAVEMTIDDGTGLFNNWVAYVIEDDTVTIARLVEEPDDVQA